MNYVYKSSRAGRSFVFSGALALQKAKETWEFSLGRLPWRNLTAHQVPLDRYLIYLIKIDRRSQSISPVPIVLSEQELGWHEKVASMDFLMP